MVTYFTSLDATFFFFFFLIYLFDLQTHRHNIQDTCSTAMRHRRVLVSSVSHVSSHVRLLRLSLFFPPPSSVSSPFAHLSFVYFPYSLPPFSSYPPFTLCPSRPLCSETRSLSDATWDAASSPVPRFSLSLSLRLSIFQRAAGKALPLPLPSPLPLWVSPFPLHPDCPKNSPYLLHTPKQRNNVLIFTCDTDAFWDSLKNTKENNFKNLVLDKLICQCTSAARSHSGDPARACTQTPAHFFNAGRQYRLLMVSPQGGHTHC